MKVVCERLQKRCHVRCPHRVPHKYVVNDYGACDGYCCCVRQFCGCVPVKRKAKAKAK